MGEGGENDRVREEGQEERLGGRRPTLTKYTPFKRQVELCIKFPMVNPLTDRFASIEPLTLLTLGAHAPEGYGSCPVCVSVCLSVCLSESLIWGLGLVEV